MVCLSRPHRFKFFKGCLPQVLLGPILNTLTHIIIQFSMKNGKWVDNKHPMNSKWSVFDSWKFDSVPQEIYLSVRNFQLNKKRSLGNNFTCIGKNCMFGQCILVHELNTKMYEILHPVNGNRLTRCTLVFGRGYLKIILVKLPSSKQKVHLIYALNQKRI